MSRDLAYEALKDDGERRWLLSGELEVVEQRHRVLRLVRRGGTAESVAEMLTKQGHEITPQIVRRIVKRHLEKMHVEDALTVEELRAQENARLDEVMRILYERVLSGDMRAIDRFIRLSARRAKLNGLDAPTRVDLGAGEGLRALGLDADTIQAATEAFKTAFRDDEIPDVEVVDDGEEPDEPEGQAPAGPEQEARGEGRPQEPPRPALPAPQVEEEAGARAG